MFTRAWLLALIFFINPAYSWHGLEPQVSGGDFILINQHGKPASLSQFHGAPVLLYFGYAQCPDVCPASLIVLKKILTNMPEKVHGVFVSVDPERDTPERLKAFLAFYHPKMQGFTGTTETVKKAADLYGVRYRRSDQNSGAGYLMDHTASIYLLDGMGKLVREYPFGTRSRVILEDLREYGELWR